MCLGDKMFADAGSVCAKDISGKLCMCSTKLINHLKTNN